MKESAMTVLCYFGKNRDQYGMQTPFHLYMIAESRRKTNAGRLATIFSLTEGSPLPNKTCYSSDEDTADAAANMATKALGQLPQLDGLSPKELRKYMVPGNSPFPFLPNVETENNSSKAPSGPDVQPPSFEGPVWPTGDRTTGGSK